MVAVQDKEASDAWLHAARHRALLHREEHFMVERVVDSAVGSFGTPQPGFGDGPSPSLCARCVVVIYSISIQISQDGYFEVNVEEIRSKNS